MIRNQAEDAAGLMPGKDDNTVADIWRAKRPRYSDWNRPKVTFV